MHVRDLDDSGDIWSPESERVDVDEVLSEIIHDFGSPIRLITTYTETLLCGESRQTEAFERNLRWIQRAGTDLDALMRALARLAAVGLAELRASEVDVSALASAVAERRLAGIAPRPRVSIQRGLRAVADASLLERLLEELIDNAVKFSAPSEQPTVDVLEEAPGTFVVRDNGVGFDPRHAAALGRPYRRLHGKEFAGWGVGLSVVRRILERHGGALTVRGHPGRGCSVAFRLGATGLGGG